MVATNDDICLRLDKIINLLQGLYGNQDVAENIKNSSDVKQTLIDHIAGQELADQQSRQTAIQK